MAVGLLGYDLGGIDRWIGTRDDAMDQLYRKFFLLLSSLMFLYLRFTYFDVILFFLPLCMMTLGSASR